jgi:hypothetical protein
MWRRVVRSVGRIAVLLCVLFLVRLAILRDHLAGESWCVTRYFAVSYANPFMSMPSRERVKTRRHERAHHDQMKRDGCRAVMLRESTQPDHGLAYEVEASCKDVTTDMEEGDETESAVRDAAHDLLRFYASARGRSLARLAADVHARCDAQIAVAAVARDSAIRERLTEARRRRVQP